MSISDAPQTDFDTWLQQEFTRLGEFTALVILVSISETKIHPLCSTYLHIVGDEIDWAEITVLFAGSGQNWHAASFFPTMAPQGGLLDNPTARTRLRELEERVDYDRLILNEGHFFDQWGRRLKVEEVSLQ